MKYMEFKMFKNPIAIVAILLLFSQFGMAKKTQVSFHEIKDNLIIALDEDENGVFNEFYVVKLLSPLNKELFKDGKYKVSLKKGVLVLVGDKHTLILTVDKSVIQVAFKQRGTYYIWVNGIAHGKAAQGTTVKEVLNSGLIDKVFNEAQSASNDNINLTLIARNEKYEENLELSYF